MELHEKLTRLLFFLLVIVVILSALTYLILDTYIPITSPFSIDDAKKRIFTLNLVDSICRTLAAIYFYGNFTLLWFYIKSRKRISFSRQLFVLLKKILLLFACMTPFILIHPARKIDFILPCWSLTLQMIFWFSIVFFLYLLYLLYPKITHKEEAFF